jgi:polyisoprenoid-binding protein YceI
VLKRTTVEFRSSAVGLDPDGSRGTVHGELELAGTRHPISFELRSEDGRLTARATVKQSDWGIKPYSALFGTLKVADEVEVGIEASLTGPLIPVDGLSVEPALDTRRQGA